MKAPTIILIVLAISSLLISGCSSDTDVRYITADVLSRPEAEPTDTTPLDISSGAGYSDSDDVSVSQQGRSSDPAAVTVTKSHKEILSSMECNEDHINLGYKTCYNTTEGYAKIYLKNSGYDDIPGLWFNVEVNEKSHYESTDIGLYGDDFVEYILDLPKWREEYGSTDRIIIIPLRETADGVKACPNRALLLEPQQSCTTYEYE